MAFMAASCRASPPNITSAVPHQPQASIIVFEVCNQLASAFKRPQTAIAASFKTLPKAALQNTIFRCGPCSPDYDLFAQLWKVVLFYAGLAEPSASLGCLLRAEGPRHIRPDCYRCCRWSCVACTGKRSMLISRVVPASIWRHIARRAEGLTHAAYSLDGASNEIGSTDVAPAHAHTEAEW